MPSAQCSVAYRVGSAWLRMTPLSSSFKAGHTTEKARHGRRDRSRERACGKDHHPRGEHQGLPGTSTEALAEEISVPCHGFSSAVRPRPGSIVGKHEFVLSSTSAWAFASVSCPLSLATALRHGNL